MPRLPAATCVPLALLALALPAAARADGVALINCWTSRETPDVSCPVDLVQGRDYELRVAGDQGAGTVELVNPAGQVLFNLDAANDGAFGREFRAGYTATYRVRLTGDERNDSPIGASLLTDCRAGTGTRCSVAVGSAPKAGRNTSNTDVDWYRVPLRKGRTYTFTLDGEGSYTEMNLRDRSGAVLRRTHTAATPPGTIRWTARYDGVHYLAVAEGRAYTVAAR